MAIQVRLKQVRQDRGFSQNELARKIEMAVLSVQHIENGRAKSIPWDTLDKLCNVLNCQVGDLLVWVPNGRELPGDAMTTG